MSTPTPRPCFVIMPYGVRPDGSGGSIDFDRVYRELIKTAVESMGFAAIRSDEITEAGSIHQDMYAHIATDDLAIVDITSLNANVFYELGVRHALKPSMTILIKSVNSTIPFNINGQRVIEYPGDSGDFAKAREHIQNFIRAGQSSDRPDSPIFAILQAARKDWRTERITKVERFPFRLVAQPQRRIVIATGDLRDHQGIDVWVNSENTNMQMSRFYDQSLSATIRYGGAVKDDNDEIVDDVIADELRAAVGGRDLVAPGNVYVTSSGALAKSHGVRKIFHAATVQGMPGSGYQAIHNVEACITACLRRMDSERHKGDELRSIAFPMIGTGAGGGRIEVIAPRLIQNALTYFTTYPDSHVSTVYFMAWNHRDLDTCQTMLRKSTEVEPDTKASTAE